jgi:uncharacterized protein YjbI with pentapeptide repeats
MADVVFESKRFGEYVVGSNGGQKLYGARLYGGDFRFMDFRGADLRFADLRGCDFTGSNLEGALLLGAHLADACFFLAKVALPAGWELVGDRASKKLNWRFDQKGRGFYEDRDATTLRLEGLWDRVERDCARWAAERNEVK